MDGMARVMALPTGRAFVAFAVTALAALFLLVIFRPGDESAAAITLDNPTAWIEHGIDGELLQINGVTGEISSRIEVAGDGDDFVAMPHADGAVVLNTSRNTISMVNGSSLTVSETIELSLAEGALDRNLALFGHDDRQDGVLVIDDDQVIHIDPGSGVVTSSELSSPLAGVVQGMDGTVFGFDGERSSVVRVAADGAAPLIVVEETATVDSEAVTDQRQMVRSGGSVFVLDPARLSMAELLATGELGQPICMRSAANGAVHGGAGPEEDPIILSLNAATSTLAISSPNGDCSDIDIDIADGEYGAPVAVDGVAYLPHWSEGRIISIDLDSGEVLNDLPFGTNGEPFELEVFGSMVWANERLGPFAAVVDRGQITPIAKLSAVLAAPGDPDVDGDGSSLAGGSNDDRGLLLIGDSGEAVIAATDGQRTGGGTSGRSTTDEPVLDQIDLAQLPAPEVFGISADNATNGDGDGEDANDGQDDDAFDVAVETEVESAAELPELAETLIANFSVSTVEATVGEIVRFTDSSLGSPVEWAWTFGDGTTQLLPNVEKAWSDAGLYEIILTVTNATGASSSQSTTVNIVPESVVLPPNADFQFSRATIEEGEFVTFESRTTGEVDLLEWDFGNERTGVGEEVTHTYETAGTFLAVLTASNEAGSTTSEVTITVLDSVEPPIAAIAPIPQIVMTDQFVTFESASLNDPTRTRWRFGDGTNANGQTTRYSWPEPGEYRITLVVENSAGTDRTFADIEVRERVVEPVSSFSQSATQVLVGETIQFTNESANSPDQFVWNFDDGETAATRNPRHSWNEAGTYRVTLRVANEAGSDRSGVTIVVNEPVDPPVASFRVGSTVIATGSDIGFQDTSANDPEQWQWEFEGAGTSTDQNPFRRWDRAGTYTVRLTASNEGGRSSSETEITVLDPPTASFRFEIVDENTVRFIDQSQNADQWRWNFGDGATSSEQNPIHDFAGGSFNVTLTTANQVATAGPASQRVTISNPPVAVATCSVSGRQLSCTSEGSARATGFAWSAAGAVTNSTPDQPTTFFSFDRTGQPLVTLTVTSAEGETDSVTIRAPSVQAGQEPRVLDVRIASIDGNLVRLESDFDRDPTRWEWNIPGAELVAGGDTSSPTFRVPGNGRYSGQVIASNVFGNDRDPVRFTVDSIAPDEPDEVAAAFTWRVIEPGVVEFVNTSTAADDAEITFRLSGREEVLFVDDNRLVVRYPDEGGTFTVTLVVRDRTGRDTFTQDVVVPPVDG